jgi:hypothetical protein
MLLFYNNKVKKAVVVKQQQKVHFLISNLPEKKIFFRYFFIKSELFNKKTLVIIYKVNIGVCLN